MKLAEKFRMPVVSLIDTPGAYPGVGSEERGVAEAIARNLLEMSRLRTAILCVVIGEGGSGGALGIGVGDRIAMMEYAYYSVISPEGCAAILWRTGEKAAEAAEAMKITARDLKALDVIDDIIPEPLGGAHRNAAEAASNLERHIVRTLRELKRVPLDHLLKHRYEHGAAWARFCTWSFRRPRESARRPVRWTPRPRTCRRIERGGVLANRGEQLRDEFPCLADELVARGGLVGGMRRTMAEPTIAPSATRQTSSTVSGWRCRSPRRRACRCACAARRRPAMVACGQAVALAGDAGDRDVVDEPAAVAGDLQPPRRRGGGGDRASRWPGPPPRRAASAAAASSSGRSGMISGVEARLRPRRAGTARTPWRKTME